MPNPFSRQGQSKRIPMLVADLHNAPVLTVGETPGFLDAGGMICFLLEENKVRFEINLDAAESARLKIGSRLLILAQMVVGKVGKVKHELQRSSNSTQTGFADPVCQCFAVILACLGFAIYERQKFRAEHRRRTFDAGRHPGGKYRCVSGLQRSEDRAGDAGSTTSRTPCVRRLLIRQPRTHFC
jgi:hypothetical protein